MLTPMPDIAALSIDLAVLAARVRDLERDLAEVRSTLTRRSRSLTEDELSTEVANLQANLAAYGPLPERTVVAAYGARVVREAIRTEMVFRDPTGERILTSLRPTEAAFARVASLIAEGPQPMSILRTAPGVNKNALADIIDRGIHEGHLKRGVIQTGKAGRPQTIVARADQPLPMYWDTFKVDWR